MQPGEASSVGCWLGFVCYTLLDVESHVTGNPTGEGGGGGGLSTLMSVSTYEVYLGSCCDEAAMAREMSWLKVADVVEEVVVSGQGRGLVGLG
jgi:hypothetical protein